MRLLDYAQAGSPICKTVKIILTLGTSNPYFIELREAKTMDPLSVTASITGIITAAAQVSTLLGQIRDAPVLVEAVLTEVDHIKLVFCALQKFLDRASGMPGGRAALIQLEDVVVILTQTVLVFFLSWKRWLRRCRAQTKHLF